MDEELKLGRDRKRRKGRSRERLGLEGNGVGPQSGIWNVMPGQNGEGHELSLDCSSRYLCGALHAEAEIHGRIDAPDSGLRGNAAIASICLAGKLKYRRCPRTPWDLVSGTCAWFVP